METSHPYDRTMPESQNSKASSTTPSAEQVASEKLARAQVAELHHVDSNEHLPDRSDEQERRRKRRRNIAIGAVLALIVLVIVIPVAVVFSTKKSSNNLSASQSSTPSSPTSTSSPNSHNTSDTDEIPKWAIGGYLDTSTWLTTLDFNTTFTDEKVGGLYVMGLNSTWDDNTRANPGVPALNEQWEYGTRKYKGVNIGGWFLQEPFISTDLFTPYPITEGIVDEWTLSAKLGPKKAQFTLETWYMTFASESTFAEIAEAGFDHVRIPFGYWAVKVYSGEPYVPMISFRYMLRAFEWARKYGLRIFLDLHGVPGSQNGWEHSGHLGPIDFLVGPQGALNGERTLEIHHQLATFFSQPRYTNLITLYGLVNEPNQTAIGFNTLNDWYKKAIPIIRNAGYPEDNLIIMSNGFLEWTSWQGQMQGYKNLVLDIHQYMVYDDYLIGFEHSDKITYACNTWTGQALNYSNPAIGFGPTMFGEWSYADTECALYQNGVGVGSRWNGTFAVGTGPQCPTQNDQCTCTPANADPSTYSAEYKLWMNTYLQAQMDSFSNGWGWFHWTWIAGPANQWSYKTGLDAGFLPTKITEPTWDCTQPIPNFGGAGLPEVY